MGLQFRVMGAVLALGSLLAQPASAQDSPQGGTVSLPPIDVGTTRAFSAYPLAGRTFLLQAGATF